MGNLSVKVFRLLKNLMPEKKVKGSEDLSED